MEELNLTLPFYGKAGTISRIVTDFEGKRYLKYEYDVNGKEKKVKPIFKRKANELKENYYLDVLGYLTVNQSKASTYHNTRLKKKVNIKALYADLIIFGIISVTGLGLSLASLQMASSIWTTVVSMLIFATSGTYCGIKIMEKYRYDEDVKKGRFLSQYKNLQIELNEFQSNKSKQHTPTMYQGLVKENSNGNTIKRTKLLEK